MSVVFNSSKITVMNVGVAPISIFQVWLNIVTEFREASGSHKSQRFTLMPYRELVVTAMTA